jgi:hypothetical protein
MPVTLKTGKAQAFLDSCHKMSFCESHQGLRLAAIFLVGTLATGLPGEDFLADAVAAPYLTPDFHVALE